MHSSWVPPAFLEWRGVQDRGCHSTAKYNYEGGGGGGGGPGWGKGAPRMGKGVPFNSQIQLRWMGEGGGGILSVFGFVRGGGEGGAGFAVCFRLTQPVGSMGAHVSTHTEYLNFYYSVVRGGGGGGGGIQS